MNRRFLKKGETQKFDALFVCGLKPNRYYRFEYLSIRIRVDGFVSKIGEKYVYSILTKYGIREFKYSTQQMDHTVLWDIVLNEAPAIYRNAATICDFFQVRLDHYIINKTNLVYDVLVAAPHEGRAFMNPVDYAEIRKLGWERNSVNFDNGGNACAIAEATGWLSTLTPKSGVKRLVGSSDQVLPGRIIFAPQYVTSEHIDNFPMHPFPWIKRWNWGHHHSLL